MQTTLRRSTSTSSRVLRRNSSSKVTTTKSATPHALSPQKMRALVSLYHQSDTFITPENLSERIDKAFTGVKREDRLLGSQQAGADTLRFFYKQAKLSPKFSEWDREKIRLPKKDAKKEGMWSSETYSNREWRVIEALYGLDASGVAEPLPGLEALEEGEGGKIGLPPSEVILNDQETHGESDTSYSSASTMSKTKSPQ